MVLIKVTCPNCSTDDIKKHGKTKDGKQRYCCSNNNCETKTFILNYSYNAYLKNIKDSIVDMAINGCGIRDTSRILKVSQNTVIKTILGKNSKLQNVNYSVLNQMSDTDKHTTSVSIRPVEESELDEMWSFVGKKENQRWLWHAIDHVSGVVLAYVFGSRKDAAFEYLKSLLEPFGIKRFYSDDWGAYKRKIPSEKHIISKKNTQKIERKHLTLRTRIKRLNRKTICFSKKETMHDTVIGIFINRYEFFRKV